MPGFAERGFNQSLVGTGRTAHDGLEVPAEPFLEAKEMSHWPGDTSDPTPTTQGDPRFDAGAREAGASGTRLIRKLPAHTAIGLRFVMDGISEAWPIVWVDLSKREDLLALWDVTPSAALLGDHELRWDTVRYAGTDVVVAYIFVERPAHAEFFLEFALPASESFLEFIVPNPRLALIQGLPRRNEAGRIRPTLDDLRAALKIAVPDPKVLVAELAAWRRRHGTGRERS